MARVGIVAGCAALIVLAATVLVLRNGDDPGTIAADPPPPTATSTPAPTPSADPGCTTAPKAFVPTTVSIPDVARKISVVALRRDSDGVPGVPPLTSAGKTEMAFDLGSGILPGETRGNALLNAHTWPDGSALGNKLLAELEKGDPIVLKGPLGQICYEVSDRVEVPALDPGIRYYDKKGQPQIAIVVCSGKRTGPGEWTKRTLWFASPVV